jgi:hypothetical protein
MKLIVFEIEEWERKSFGALPANEKTRHLLSTTQ